MSLATLPNAKLVAPLIDSLYRMAWLVEARDPYTGGHLWRVSQYARLLAEALGWPAAEVARVSLGGFLHDLGKIGVPDAILNKRDRLDEEEYDIIKTHPAIGARLIQGHPLEAMVAAAIVQHHEMPDGRGYPAGLQGDAISADARIVGVCDAFDAMTSTRPYRAGMPVAKALAIIREEAGKQFDADVAHCFIRLGEQGKLDHFVGHTDLGIPLQNCGMCGPTIVVPRHRKVGDYVYCRSCGAEARIEAQGHGAVRIAATGRQGAAAAREAEVDDPLLAELIDVAVRQLAPLLPAKRSWLPRWLAG